ncbi:Leucine-rich repeat - like 10 [Theobroma cacao]|nr:Leucine-rich repeat - like 10 [Theobroma cacao]
MLDIYILDLHKNIFHGNIPDSFVVGNELQTLNLQNNDFDGPFPKSMVNCHDLQVLNLGNNKINDTFPHWLGGLPQLQVLVLRSNYFHGQIILSEAESNFSALRILDLLHNEFSGSLPTTYFKSFKGHIPSSLENLAALESLDLSSNKLVGEIPMQLTGLKFLEVLNLSQNQLVGLIPQGNQFNTFLNDYYGGNLGLCGFLVSKTCGKGDAQEPPETAFHEEGLFSSPLDWKFVIIGYGCGWVLGLSAGYIILTIGKPEWLVRMVQRVGYKILR